METMDMIQVRTPKNVKTNAMDILDKLGLNMSTYINMALNQLIIQGGIPFAVKLERSTDRTDQIVREVEATMNLEGLSLSTSDIKLFRAVANGDITADQARQIIYREMSECKTKNKEE